MTTKLELEEGQKRIQEMVVPILLEKYANAKRKEERMLVRATEYQLEMKQLKEDLAVVGYTQEQLDLL